MSRIQPPDCSKLAKTPRNDNDVTIFWHDINIKFFWRFASLVKFSYWSKFHVNIITGSGVMTISFYKGFFITEIRRSKIPPSDFYSISGDWGEQGIPSLVSNKVLLNAAKCQGYSFYRFWVIKGKPTGEVNLPNPSTHPLHPD